MHLHQYQQHQRRCYGKICPHQLGDICCSQRKTILTKRRECLDVRFNCCVMLIGRRFVYLGTECSLDICECGITIQKSTISQCAFSMFMFTRPNCSSLAQSSVLIICHQSFHECYYYRLLIVLFTHLLFIDVEQSTAASSMHHQLPHKHCIIPEMLFTIKFQH